jgi:hypothetical protein
LRLNGVLQSAIHIGNDLRVLLGTPVGAMEQIGKRVQ